MNPLQLDEDNFARDFIAIHKLDRLNSVLALAHKYYYNPNNSIALIYNIELLKTLSGAANLTDEQCMSILTKLWIHFDQSPLLTFKIEDLIQEELHENQEKTTEVN